jgi:ATP-binding protein involved in chromosome partitioning
MSYFVGSDGAINDIFGRGGAERAARQLEVPFLGELPMFTELRVNSDAGNPTANFEGNAKLRESIEAIVKRLAGEVSKRNLTAAGPTLNIS